MPLADQIRCTVAGLTPFLLGVGFGMRRLVSASGFSCSVACTISAIRSCPMLGLRPRPGRTPPRPFRPSSPKRSRHALTVVGRNADDVTDRRVGLPVAGQQQRTRAVDLAVGGHLRARQSFEDLAH